MLIIFVYRWMYMVLPGDYLTMDKDMNPKKVEIFTPE